MSEQLNIKTVNHYTVWRGQEATEILGGKQEALQAYPNAPNLLLSTIWSDRYFHKIRNIGNKEKFNSALVTPPLVQTIRCANDEAFNTCEVWSCYFYVKIQCGWWRSTKSQTALVSFCCLSPFINTGPHLMQDSRTYVSVSDCSCFFLLPFTFHHHWATFDARLPDICFSVRRLLLSHQMPHSLPVCGWDMNGHYELKEHVVFFSQLSLPCYTVYRAILGSQPCIDALWHSDATWRRTSWSTL